MAGKRISGRRLLEFAIATEDGELAAMVLLAGSLEFIEELQRARQEISVQERFGELCRFLVDPAPAPRVAARVGR
jgi:hypothetical protein